MTNNKGIEGRIKEKLEKIIEEGVNSKTLKNNSYVVNKVREKLLEFVLSALQEERQRTKRISQKIAKELKGKIMDADTVTKKEKYLIVQGVEELRDELKAKLEGEK
jgi:hypothetical protein